MEQELRTDARRARGRRRTHVMGERFLLQAERDIEFARILVVPRGYYLAANLAHQAAEKALKGGCWRVCGEEPPWKHSLRQLAELLVDDPSQIPDRVAAAIASLNPIFEQTRYPSANVGDPIPADLVDAAVAQDALGAADEVMRWVRQLFQSR